MENSTPAQALDPMANMRKAEPVTVGEWILVSILMAIPLVNLAVILYLIFASKVKMSLRNFALAGVIIIGVGFVLGLVLSILIGLLASGNATA